MARGSGLQWTIDQMGTELAREVKHEILDRLAASGVDRVETNVIYAIAGRSAPDHSALTRIAAPSRERTANSDDPS